MCRPAGGSHRPGSRRRAYARARRALSLAIGASSPFRQPTGALGVLLAVASAIGDRLGSVRLRQSFHTRQVRVLLSITALTL